MRTGTALSALCMSVLGIAGLAAEWYQWRGPQRNGISSETGILSQFPATGPRRVWSARVGVGYSSVAIRDNRLYTMGNVDGQDVVYCLEANTGRVLWQHRYPCPPGDYSGPRATPTLDGSAVYTLSREGHAFALNADNGRVLWSKDLAREVGAERPRWGFASSPLVEGSLVIYNVGSAGTAVDKRTGRTVWRSQPSGAGYSSPVAHTLNGQRFIALFTTYGLVAVSPANGRILWQFRWETQYDINAADPVFQGDTVFISSNYNKGGALLRIGGGTPTVIWQNRNMRNHFNTSVLINGFLYGNDENTLKCIDWRTGAERWRMRGMDKGGLIAADGKLICLTGRGALMLVQATPEKYTELASAQVLRGTTWTPPVLTNGLLYCRSQEGELICLDLRGR